jgi:hypothetical protein
VLLQDDEDGEAEAEEATELSSSSMLLVCSCAGSDPIEVMTALVGASTWAGRCGSLGA